MSLRGVVSPRGRGFATTEMRLVMIRAVDRALTFHRTITPTLFVDDLAAEVCGPAHVIKEELGGFIEKIAEFVAETGQELSPTKSLCTASSDELGKALCKRWERSGINIHFRKKVKALGVGLGAGRRRNAGVARGRLQSYMARLTRMRRLRKVGVSTARLIRTGLRTVTYGSSVLGVPDGLLRAQRQAAAAVAAPGNGTGGQNIDFALMLADEGAKGRADPAYDAHLLPIGEWPQARWEN